MLLSSIKPVPHIQKCDTAKDLTLGTLSTKLQLLFFWDFVSISALNSHKSLANPVTLSVLWMSEWVKFQQVFFVWSAMGGRRGSHKLLSSSSSAYFKVIWRRQKERKSKSRAQKLRNSKGQIEGDRSDLGLKTDLYKHHDIGLDSLKHDVMLK